MNKIKIGLYERAFLKRKTIEYNEENELHTKGSCSICLEDFAIDQ